MKLKEEACQEDVSSTEMVTEIPRSPAICVQRNNKITEKRKTVNVRVSDSDRGRCYSKNILGVIIAVDLTKDWYRIGTKDGILNSWYARNQFSTCTEGTVNIADVPSVNVS